MSKGKKSKKDKLSKKQRKALEAQISEAIEEQCGDFFGAIDGEMLGNPDLIIEDELYLEEEFDEIDYIEMMFSEVGRDLFLSGAITSHGGNLSWFDGENIWITRTGSQLGNLGPGDVIATTWDPSDLDKNCSSELIVHRALYHAMRERCEAEGKTFEQAAVVHAHTKYTTLRSFDEDEISAVDSECKYLIPHTVKVVRPAQSIGSPEGAAMLADIVRSGENIGIIGGHGPFCIADTLPGAMQLVSSLEHSCFLAEMLDKKKARERLADSIEKLNDLLGSKADEAKPGEVIADGVRNVATVLQEAIGAVKTGLSDTEATE